jgi:hypothetical protein
LSHSQQASSWSNPSTPPSTAVWDDSKWDESKWSDGKKYEDILHRLEVLDRNSGKKHRFANQSRDARIAESAIENGLTLVSRDQNLIEIMREFGGKFLSL